MKDVKQGAQNQVIVTSHMLILVRYLSERSLGRGSPCVSVDIALLRSFTEVLDGQGG